MVQAVPSRSIKSRLLCPTPGDIAKLAAKSQRIMAAEMIKGKSKPNPKPAPVPARRRLKHRLGPDKIEEIVHRYRSGETTPALSREHGIFKSGLLDLLRDQGVSLRKQPIPKDHIEKAAQLYQSGLSIQEVVDQIGYSYSTIRKALHQHGVTMRPKGIKRSSL